MYPAQHCIEYSDHIARRPRQAMEAQAAANGQVVEQLLAPFNFPSPF
jgi:hypothetical protein